KTRLVLRELAGMNATVEFHRQDATGETTEVGKCKLHEFDEENGVLVADVPTLDGRPLHVQPEEIGWVYFQRSGGLFRFPTTVLQRRVERDQHSGWYSAMFLAAPAVVENGNRRRHFRVTPLPKDMPKISWRPITSNPAHSTDLPWVPAALRDICGRGLSIWVSQRIWERLRIGLRLELIVQLPGDRPLLTTESIIRRLIDDPARETENAVCLEFQFPIDDPETCIDPIATYVAECQREIARTNR